MGIKEKDLEEFENPIMILRNEYYKIYGIRFKIVRDKFIYKYLSDMVRISASVIIDGEILFTDVEISTKSRTLDIVWDEPFDIIITKNKGAEIKVSMFQHRRTDKYELKPFFLGIRGEVG